MASLLIATTMASGLLIGGSPTTVQSRSFVRMGLHDLSAKAMDGTTVELNTLTGKNVIALNVASRWGATGKVYKQLADWNKKVDDLEILLFPSDEFGGQELPADEIAPFLQGFKLTKDLPLDGDGGCRLMEKVTVNGDDAHPVFQLGKESFPGDVTWNFAGIFLFNGDGACIGRYDAKGLKELGAALA